MTEKQFQQSIVELAHVLGWLVFHPYDSRRSTPGFPDLCLVRDRVVFIEVKTEKGKLSEHQRAWMRALLAASTDAFVVRPHDLESLAAVLAARIPPVTVLGRHAACDALRLATLEEAA